MIQFINPLSVADVKEELAKRIERTKHTIWLYGKLIEVLEPREGQKITKRIATAYKKAIGPEGYYLYYRHDYGHYTLNVQDNGIAPGESITFYIGYDRECYVCMDRIHNDHCKWEEGAPVRLAKMIAAWDKIEGLVDRWNAGLDTLKQIHQDALSQSEDLEYIFDIKGR